jgi:uncharacterized membrane protein YfcA
MVYSMSLETIVFVIGTFIAAFVTGISGFAFGMVAAAIWLQALTPVQTTLMIVAYALLVQGYAVWKLRSSIVGPRLWPFLVGSAVGIPLGLLALKWLSAAQLKSGTGILLILFSTYNLLSPKMPSVAWAGRSGDGLVGVLNGGLGASTGLAGILVVIWSSMRGWSRDEQRAVFQPTAVATFLMCLLAFGGAGVVSADSMWLFALGLPALVIGTLVGWAVYGKLSEAAFRKVVLWLLLCPGLVLAATGR